MPPSTASPASGRRTRLLRAVRRTVLARRRPIAAVCAALAVIAAVQAARRPPPPTVRVTVASHELAPGAVLRPRDLEVRGFPADAAPAGSASAASMVGRTLTGPVGRGEPVTDVRLVSPSLLRGYPGRVVVPVRIADGDAVGLLRPGDRVDVLAADPRRGTASYVATGVPVVALPVSVQEGSGRADVGGRLVVVAALPDDVVRLAGAAATDLLSLVISG